MSTLSVPLTDDLRNGIKMLVLQGKADNDAEVARKAIRQYLEEQAVETVLQAQKEPSLDGDLDELAKKL